MRDEHLIYTELSDGKVRIVPQEGYKMLNTQLKQYFAEAIASPKRIGLFVSEAIE